MRSFINILAVVTSAAWIMLSGCFLAMFTMVEGNITLPAKPLWWTLIAVFLTSLSATTLMCAAAGLRDNRRSK